MPRYIRLNHSTVTPTNILIVDTETRPDYTLSDDRRKTHKLFLGVARHMRYEAGMFRNDTYHYFHSIPAFWQIVAKFHSRRHPLTIYSHNAGFDATICGVWDRIRKGEIGLDFLVSESPPTIIVMTFNGSTLRWYDSLNWFKCSVERLGNDFGIPKLSMPVDYESKAEWARYCERDVDIVATAIMSLYDFVRVNNLGVLRPTVGSQSLQTYRHRFMKTQEIFKYHPDRIASETNENDEVSIITPHSNSDAIAVERQSYYHCDRWIYRVGKVGIWNQFSIIPDEEMQLSLIKEPKDLIYRLDVNSLFPHVMRGNQYPVRLVDQTINASTIDMLRLSKSYGIIAECQVDCDAEYYPIKWKGGSIQVTGRYWTTLAGPELISAIRKGHLRCGGRCFLYKTDDIFSDYIEYFNQQRRKYQRNGNKAFAHFCKDMMTNLYGKFAQLQGKWSETDEVDPPVAWGDFTSLSPLTNKVETYRVLDGIVQVYRRDSLADHSFFAIPAFVTSYARLYMKELLKVCGEHNVYYSYIDSIHTNIDGFSRLAKRGYLHPTKMGKLKIEEVSSYAEYRNVGDYSFGGEDKIVGISKKATKLAEGTYKVLNFERLDSVIQRGGESMILITDEIKTLDRKIQCGTVSEDGRTKRLHLQRPVREDYNVISVQSEEGFSDASGE